MIEYRTKLLDEMKTELSNISIKEDIEKEIKNNLNNISLLTKLNNSELSIVSEINNIIYLLNKEIILSESSLEYFNLLINKLNDNNSFLNNFEIEMNNIAENTYFNLLEYSKFNKLTEENETEISDILTSHIKSFISSLSEVISKIKNYSTSYLSNSKSLDYLNIDEKKEVDFLNSTLRLSINNIYNISKNNLLLNISSLTDKENKNEVIRLFKSYQSSIKSILLSIISLRLLMGNISNKYGIESHLDSLYNSSKSEVLNKVIASISVSSIEQDRTNSISIQVKNTSPLYNELLNYIINTNENKMPSPSEVGNLFIKRMKLSGKYIHHIDQLVSSANDINVAIIDLIDKLTSSPLDEALTGFDINLFSNLVASIKNELACLKTDIECANKTSHSFISDVFKKQISTNSDDAHTIWDIYTRNRFHDNN